MWQRAHGRSTGEILVNTGATGALCPNPQVLGARAQSYRTSCVCSLTVIRLRHGSRRREGAEHDECCRPAGRPGPLRRALDRVPSLSRQRRHDGIDDGAHGLGADSVGREQQLEGDVASGPLRQDTYERRAVRRGSRAARRFPCRHARRGRSWRSRCSRILGEHRCHRRPVVDRRSEPCVRVRRWLQTTADPGDSWGDRVTGKRVTEVTVTERDHDIGDGRSRSSESANRT
jgi:hypothetical protein